MAILFKGALVIVVVCLCCDLMDCINVRRRDVHRIVLKSRVKGRSKKSPNLHLADHHNRYYYPREPNHYPYADHYAESSSINQETYQNPHYYQKNRNKSRTPYGEFEREVKYERPKPGIYYENAHLDDYSGHGHYFDDNSEPESTNNYASDLRNFKKYKEIMDFYNRRQEEEYQKEIAKAKRQRTLFERLQQQQQQQREHPWKDSEEALSQEESVEHPVWQSSNDDYYKAVWNPIVSVSKPDKKQTRRNTSRHAKNPYNIEYLIDMTTSKPAKIPPTIIEENSSEEFSSNPMTVSYDLENSLYPNHKSNNEINQDFNQSSYEVSEEETVLPIVASFQNIAPMQSSYSTLLKQMEGDDVSSSKKKKKETRSPYGVRIKSNRFKRPAPL